MEITLQNLPLTIFMQAIEILALNFYMNHLCTPKYNKYLFAAFYAVYAVIYSTIFRHNFSQAADLRAFLSIFLTVIFSTICFKDKFSYKAMCVGVMFFSNALVSVIIMIIFKLIGMDITIFSQVDGVILNILRIIVILSQYSIAFLIMKLISRKLTYALKISYYFIGAMLMYYSICIYLIYTLSKYNDSIGHTLFIIATAAIISTFCIFMAFRATQKLHKEEIIATQKEDDYKHFKEQLSTMQNNYFEFRKLCHDFKDHLLVIDTLVKSGETDKLNSYISSIQKDMNDISGLVFCHNTAINVIAASKYNMAKSRNINLNINISIPENLNIDDIYLCSLLSNILQNALENTPRKGNIDFKMFLRVGQIVIVCVNDTDKNVHSLETHKTDKENHGYGIKIIKSITDTLDGNCILEYNKNNKFSVMINIPVSVS